MHQEINSKNYSNTFYRTFLYMKVEFYDSSFSIDQRLNSFFGQMGVYENTEDLSSFVDNIYFDTDIENNIFLEKKDYSNAIVLCYVDEQESEDFCNEELEYKDYTDFTSNVLEYGIYDNDENKKLTDNETSDETTILETDDYIEFFAALLMVYYRHDRKMDYYLANEFKSNFFFKEKILTFSEDLNLNKFKKGNFFFKKKIIFSSNFLNKSYNKNFFFLINNSDIMYLNSYFKTFNVYDAYQEAILHKKKRIKMFKKIKIRRKNSNLLLLKSFKWWHTDNIFYLLNLKFFCFSKNYSHINYINGIFYFFSQIKNIKNKFIRKRKKKKKLKRKKRRRKFRKNMFRNFFGEKAGLQRVLNWIDEENAKKKKQQQRRRR